MMRRLAYDGDDGDETTRGGCKLREGLHSLTFARGGAEPPPPTPPLRAQNQAEELPQESA